MAPTSRSSTVTRARVTRWTTARMQDECRGPPGNPPALPGVQPVARMPAPMPLRRLAPFVALAVALAASACGSEIGDACYISSDCSPNSDRVCDTSFDAEGYCTVVGCDETSCPEE